MFYVDNPPMIKFLLLNIKTSIVIQTVVSNRYLPQRKWFNESYRLIGKYIYDDFSYFHQLFWWYTFRVLKTIVISFS